MAASVRRSRGCAAARFSVDLVPVRRALLRCARCAPADILAASARSLCRPVIGAQPSNPLAHHHRCHRGPHDTQGINAVCLESRSRRRESPSQNLESDYRKFFRFYPTCGHVDTNFIANAVASATPFPSSESQPCSFATLVPSLESSASDAESDYRKLR